MGGWVVLGGLAVCICLYFFSYLAKGSNVYKNTSRFEKNNASSNNSILLVPVRVVDELPVQLFRLLGIELLSALGALKIAFHFDADVGHGAVARLRGSADLHRLGHRYNRSVSVPARDVVMHVLEFWRPSANHNE